MQSAVQAVSGAGCCAGAVQAAVAAEVWLLRGCCSQCGDVSGKDAVQVAVQVAVGAVRLLLTESSKKGRAG